MYQAVCERGEVLHAWRTGKYKLLNRLPGKYPRVQVQSFSHPLYILTSPSNTDTALAPA